MMGFTSGQLAIDMLQVLKIVLLWFLCLSGRGLSFYFDDLIFVCLHVVCQVGFFRRLWCSRRCEFLDVGVGVGGFWCWYLVFSQILQIQILNQISCTVSVLHPLNGARLAYVFLRQHRLRSSSDEHRCPWSSIERQERSIFQSAPSHIIKSCYTHSHSQRSRHGGFMVDYCA